MIEKRPSVGNQKIDFVGFSYKLATYFPLPFWILIYNFNMLSVLFPSYKEKDLVFPIFFFTGLILILAASIAFICDYIIATLEKGRFPQVMSSLRCPLNELLHEYINKKLYWRLLLLITNWVSVLIVKMAMMTTFFGMFIAFKYNIN